MTEDRYQKLSQKYEDEQVELNQKLKHLRKIVKEEQLHEMNADGFLTMIKEMTDVSNLNHDILNRFIDKIIVHHREERFGETVQKVEIFYKMIGKVELPEMDSEEKERYLRCFGREKSE